MEESIFFSNRSVNPSIHYAYVPHKSPQVFLATYSQAEILALYSQQPLSEFSGGARGVYEPECHVPELLSGKEVILVSINSAYVKAKHSDPKSRTSSSLIPESGVRMDSDGWLEVSRRATRAGSSVKLRGGSEIPKPPPPPEVKGAPNGSPPITATSSNKFADLLLDSNGSFFQDEEPESPSPRSDGSKVVKMLESKTASPNSGPVRAEATTDLSSNAPSFTPMSHRTSPPPPVSPRDSSQLLWVYLDPNGARQGPFTSPQMTTWYSAGYFPKSLPVFWYRAGEAADPSSQFHPLDRCYSPNVAPFLTPPTKPSIASQSRGWIWSQQEDASASDHSSLADIMKAEQAFHKSDR